MHTLRRCSSIAIWGFGKEGQAALDFISAHYPHIRLTILNDTPLAKLPPAIEKSVRVVTGAAISDSISRGDFETIIRSPGVNPYRQEIQDAIARGIACTTATNVWLELHESPPTIAITGTKGKSTTSGLIYHMLQTAGLDVKLLGNVGVPALGQPPGGDYTVLELSSYQIADLAQGPDIAVITNLYPEHTPWHGSVERYYADKLRLLALREDTRAVCNYADKELRTRLAQRANITWFNHPDGFHVRDDHLYRGDHVVDTSRFPLKGAHNLVNLAAACTVLELLGLDVGPAINQLDGFRQLPHRLQETLLDNNILCVNDSISTIPEATIAALKTYSQRETVLFLGGTERGQDYAELYEYLLHSRVRSVVLLPPNGERIYRELSERALPFEVVQAENLADAVHRAFSRMTPNMLLLLSPGAPSFGEFLNFEERGLAFEKLCRAHY